MGVPTPQFSTSTDGRVLLWRGHEPASYVDAATARAAIGAGKNYIINGDMRVSEENGSASGTLEGYYPVDGFVMGRTHGGTTTAQQVASVTPSGSPNRIRVTATVADAAVAVGDYLMIEHRIEGNRIADLMLGTSRAKTFTVQFGCNGPAGTFCVTALNGAYNRSRVLEYTIAPGEANTDVVKSVTIPGDVTGTWLTDTGIGLVLRWGLMAGTTLQQDAGSWGTANAVGSPNQFNFMGTVSNVFELFDVSLTVGSTAPSHQVADYAETLQACKRYYAKQAYTHRFPSAGPGSIGESTASFPSMRAAPTTSVSGGTLGNVFSVDIFPLDGTGGRIMLVAAAAGDCYAVNFVGALNARL